MKVNIAKGLERNRELYANKPAIIFEEKIFTYRVLDEMVNRVANGLQQLGVDLNDRVALFLPNHIYFVVSYLAIQKIGGIAVSLNNMLRTREIKLLLNDSNAVVLITTAELFPNVPDLEQLPVQHVLIAEGVVPGHESLEDIMSRSSSEAQAVERKWDDPAALVYTSGTTGIPKGATLSQGNVIFNSQSKQRYLKIRPDDRLILFLPLFHCFGQNAVLNSGLYSGATIVLHRRFEVNEVIQSVAQNQVTMFFAVPTIFILMLSRVLPQDLESIRYYFSAAAPLPPEIAKMWHKRFGLPIHEGYGLTETSPFASYNHHVHYKPGSIGTPIEGVEIKVLTDEGQEAAPGELGEIVIRGPNIMLGYWNKPEETIQAIQEDWFYTGDIGKQDEDGYFFIVDRIKDMINVAGLKVYPTEVENIFYQHETVDEVAVYGIPDPITGEKVVAKVVLKEGVAGNQEELFALCREHIAGYKVPSTIQFVESLPKGRTGKVLKKVLRETERLDKKGKG